GGSMHALRATKSHIEALPGQVAPSILHASNQSAAQEVVPRSASTGVDHYMSYCQPTRDRNIQEQQVMRRVAKTTGCATTRHFLLFLGRTCCETLLPFPHKWQPNIATRFYARKPGPI